ncbi:MAG: PUA domain-containing protein [Planctomycetota bacterium]
MSSRKRWIGSAAKPRGVLRLDAGACRAVVEKGSSLLPIGIVGVEGDFAAGDVVALVSDAANDSIAGGGVAGGGELARGLTNYAADEVRAIMRRSSDDIAGLLGRRPYLEVVHRDNLAVLA